MNDHKLFINFSNHPSSGWSKEQMAHATRCGDVVDLPFPLVDPLMTSEQVQELAAQSVKTILDMGNPAVLTVHAMGEMTLVYHVVNALKARGVRCVASTTERIVTEADGIKMSQFRFVTFRDY